MKRLSAVVLGSVLVLASLADGQTAARVIVFEHGTVIDGISNDPLRNATVVVRDGKIESVGTSPTNVPASAQHVDLGGRWVLPGLIDAHVHPFSLAGARNMLRAGVTTARSMFTVFYIDVGLRELHRRGASDIPEILAAGYPVVPVPTRFRPDITGLFLDNPQLDDLLKDSDIGVDGVRRLVQTNLDRHIEVLKVFATGRAFDPTADPRDRMLSDAELAAAVEMAHKAGIPVAAHAHGDEGAAAAVRAGVNSVEHGTYLSDATLRLMREHNVCFTPTISAVAAETTPNPRMPGAEALAARSRAMLPMVREATRHAHATGVRVIAGADAAYEADDPHQISDELAELVAAGFSPMEAIQAATSKSAECLGISNRTGAVRNGLEADFIVVEQSPLDDINALRNVLMVVNDGKIAINKLKF